MTMCWISSNMLVAPFFKKSSDDIFYTLAIHINDFVLEVNFHLYELNIPSSLSHMIIALVIANNPP
jgi:hypothetical protein